MTKKKASELLAAASNDDVKDCSNLEKLLRRHHDKNDSFDLSEHIDATPTKGHETIWENIAGKVRPLIEQQSFLLQQRPSPEEEGDDVEMKDDAEPDLDAHLHARDQVANALGYLRVVGQLMQVWIQSKSRVAPDPLLEVACNLHSIIFQLRGVEGSSLQGIIARICEKWWVDERPGAELLVTQLLPFLIVKSLEEDSREVDVKRVYAIRNTLLLLDFEDESIQSLKGLLLRCFLHPNYLRAADGRRFLGFVFGLHPDFIDEIHATVLNQVPFQRKSVLATYGDLYLKAWRGSNGQYTLKLEYNCIQDVINRAIHAKTAKIFNNLKLLLKAFHENKRLKGVDEMLLRLYEPILWRSLKAANSIVRRQAATLLVDVFPLQSPGAAVSEADALLQKQFDCLGDLIQDPDPSVRVVGVQGISRVLGLFWELIPLQMIKFLLTQLAGELVYDKASPAVRTAVFQGLDFILDNHLSHGVMKTLLPSLSPLIHDQAAPVRLSFVRLLLRVKKIRGIAFYKIVEVDDLLGRLVQDKDNRPMVAALTQLFLNSYFPQGVTNSEQIRRFFAFVRRNQAAASTFYSSLHLHASVGAVCKFALVLLRVLVTAEDGGKGKRRVVGSNDENSPDGVNVNENRKKRKAKDEDSTDKVFSILNPLTPPLSRRLNFYTFHPSAKGEEKETPALRASDIALVTATVQIAWGMLESVSKKLKEDKHKAALLLLHQELRPQDIRALLDRYKDQPAITTSLRMIFSLLPGDDSAGQRLSSDVKALATWRDEEAGPLIHCLCAWGRAETLIQTALKALESESSTSTSSKEKSSGQISVLSALKILDYILANEPASREKLLLQLRTLQLVFRALEGILGKTEKLLASDSRIDHLSQEETIVLAVHVYGKLTIHEAGKEEVSSQGYVTPQRLNQLVLWTSKHVVPALTHPDDEVFQSHRDLGLRLLSSVLCLACESAAIGGEIGQQMDEVSSWLYLLTASGRVGLLLEENVREGVLLAGLFCRFLSLSWSSSPSSGERIELGTLVKRVLETLRNAPSDFIVKQLRRLLKGMMETGSKGKKEELGAILVDTLMADFDLSQALSDLSATPRSLCSLSSVFTSKSLLEQLTAIPSQLGTTADERRRRIIFAVFLLLLVFDQAPKMSKRSVHTKIKEPLATLHKSLQHIISAETDDKALALLSPLNEAAGGLLALAA